MDGPFPPFWVSMKFVNGTYVTRGRGGQIFNAITYGVRWGIDAELQYFSSNVPSLIQGWEAWINILVTIYPVCTIYV